MSPYYIALGTGGITNAGATDGAARYDNNNQIPTSRLVSPSHRKNEHISKEDDVENLSHTFSKQNINSQNDLESLTPSQKSMLLSEINEYESAGLSSSQEMIDLKIALANLGSIMYANSMEGSH